MIALRPYQETLVQGCRDVFRRGERSVLIQLATGGGKTMTSAFMVKRSSEKGLVCWWLVHRREIISQASKQFSSLDIPHGVVMGGHCTDRMKRVQIGSIQTVVGRLDKLPAPDLIFFDEAHHMASGQYQAVFDAFPKALIVGMTATPWRLDGTGLGRWFADMVRGPSVRELMDSGSLSKYRLFAPTRPDLSDVGVTAGDYRKDQLAKLMDKPVIVGEAIDHYLKLCAGKRAIAFNSGILNSQHLVQRALHAGIPAEHVDGTTPKDQRDAAIERLERGELHILSNDSLFGEGVDVPAVEAVIDLAPSKSLTKVLQNWGRAFRPAPGKEYAYLLDHAGNSMTHGLPDDERDWTLTDRERRRTASEATVTIRTCTNCFAVYHPVPECPHCGHVHVAQVREIEQVDGDLVEVDVAALRQREIQAKKKEQGQAQSLEELISVGRARGQRNPERWAQHVIQGREEAQRFADSIGLTPMQVKIFRKDGMPAASKGRVAALMWIRAEKASVFAWIEREHPEVFTSAVLDEIGADVEMAA